VPTTRPYRTTARPGQRDAQLFWLALLGPVRTATGGAESPARGARVHDRQRCRFAAAEGNQDVCLLSRREVLDRAASTDEFVEHAIECAEHD
jgi:hypothetical protein